MEQKRYVPDQLLVNGRPYTSAAATDVVRTWMRHGWQPPSRENQQQAKEKLNPMGTTQ